MPLASREITCFANDWTADPTSKHHIMRHLAEQNRILWVETAGMRRPRLSSARDLTRIGRKLRSFFAAPRQRLPTLWSYSPPSIPLPGSALVAQINRTLYQRAICRQWHRLGMRVDPILWIYAPHVAPWIRKLPRQRLVYHCVDRWSAFQDYDAAQMARCEAEICRNADLVVASAEDLADRCRSYGAIVHYVPHGVDHAHFASALKPGALPADLRDIPGPRIGFFGLIHEWVDTELIGVLADALPCSIVLIGDSNQDLSALLARSNVFHLGRKPYAELPSYCRGFQAAIVPFRRSELTVSVNPIKLREYAAAGLPIVATDLPEIRRAGQLALCATVADDWKAALELALRRGADPEERRAQSARVADQDWSAVSARIGDLVQATLERPDAPKTDRSIQSS